jgi:DNA-binding transcriptional MerR regulator/effector-binding domain-containing protein
VVMQPLTIGDFSRITHLSVKTLRYYHRVGLLEPADVNADTGYRYYTVGQVQTAQAIRRYRDLEMPVDDVRSVLAAPDDATRDALLAAHLDRLQAQLARTESAVASLRDLLTKPKGAIDIEHRRVEAEAALAIRDVVDKPSLGLWWQAALRELPPGPVGGLFADELFTEERGEASLFVPSSSHEGGRAVPFVVPAAELAVTVHQGSHADADRTYAALGSYVAERGLEAPGPVREYYLVGLRETADETQWRTEIGWPISSGGHRPEVVSASSAK